MELKGKKLSVIIEESGAVAYATEHTLDISSNLLTERTKDDADGPVADLDYNDWTVTSQSVMGSNGTSAEQTYEDLIAIMLDGDTVSLVMDCVDEDTDSDGSVPDEGWAPDMDTTRFVGFTGEAIISDVSINAGSDGYGTLSVTFKGVGPLS